MTTIPEISQSSIDRAAQKQRLFAYLDDVVNAPAEWAEVGIHEQLPELYSIKPVRIPPNIFLYWHDGWDKAPELAKLCLKSWQLSNPTYNVYALDYTSLGTALREPPSHKANSKLAGFSDRVRVKILQETGGVWADATLFCSKPLDSWLHLMVPVSQFFALASPAPDRIISSWFLASTTSSPIVDMWERIVSRYFLKLEEEKRWVHSYFFLHYILEYLCQRHPYSKELWDAMPKVPVQAAATRRLSSLARLTKMDDASKQLPMTANELDAARSALKTIVMHKLTWKAAMREKSAASEQMMGIKHEFLQEIG